jgi:hypothetical protein
MGNYSFCEGGNLGGMAYIWDLPKTTIHAFLKWCIGILNILESTCRISDDKPCFMCTGVLPFMLYFARIGCWYCVAFHMVSSVSCFAGVLSFMLYFSWIICWYCVCCIWSHRCHKSSWSYIGNTRKRNLPSPCMFINRSFRLYCISWKQH